MGTLKKLSSNKVESSEGFIFQLINTEYCRYEEKTAFMETQWFYEPKEKFFYIDHSTIHTWQSPPRKMTPQEIKRVNSNIDKALKFLYEELYTSF